MSASLRSKLQLASGTGPKDNGSLHRWVLLKNSFLKTLSLPHHEEPEPESEHEQDEEHDTFMFPDADALVVLPRPTPGPEQQWFDSLLETLDDDDDDLDEESPLPALPDSDDDEVLFSPTASPMSSSDDLVTVPTASSPVYYPSPIAIPYPVPYPPYVPPPLLGNGYPSLSVYGRDPLDLDMDDMPVPDAVADDSDDDSDAPSTPSLLRSSALRRPHVSDLQPHVVDPDEDGLSDSYFYEPDPLPFAFPDDARHRAPTRIYPARGFVPHQEC